MIRRCSLLALGALLVGVMVGGCGGGVSPTPTATLLTDPGAILTSSVDSLQSIRTLHIDAMLNGSIDMAAAGGFSGGLTSGLSGLLKLDNSTLSGDVDVAHHAAHLSASVPNLLGLTLDYILGDGSLYGKVNLSGEKYTRTKESSILPQEVAGIVPSASLDVATAVASFKTAMDQAGVTTTLAGREPVDGRDAYHVTITIPKGELNQAIGAAAGSAAGDLTVDSVSLDYWAYVDTLQPARLRVQAGSLALGTLDLTMTLSRYDQPVTISAPPDSEIQAG